MKPKYQLTIKPPHEGYPAWLRRVEITANGEQVTSTLQMHKDHAERLQKILKRGQR